MAAVASMPGNWPRDGETDDELFIPGLRRRRMDAAPETRTSTPYPFTPSSQDGMTVPGLRLQLRGNSRQNPPQPPYPTSPITPDELFIPGLDLPARGHRQREPTRRPPPPPPVATDEQQFIPRLNLRVDTLTMQTVAQNIPPTRRLGELYTNTTISRVGETSQSGCRSSQYFTSPGIHDELFFDCPSPFSPSNVDNNGEGNSSTHLAFEPIITDEPNIEGTDWRRYEPPMELQRPQDGTSVIIESILVPSIDRIRRRHEEEARRAAVTRTESLLEGFTRLRRESLNVEPVSSSKMHFLTYLMIYISRCQL